MTLTGPTMPAFRFSNALKSILLAHLLLLMAPAGQIVAAADCPRKEEAVKHDSLTLFVRAACGGAMVEGATVSIITSTGDSVVVGTTNIAGAIEIPVATLASAETITVCAEGYFCGALARRDLTAGMEILVVLAPWAVM